MDSNPSERKQSKGQKMWDSVFTIGLLLGAISFLFAVACLVTLATISVPLDKSSQNALLSASILLLGAIMFGIAGFWAMILGGFNLLGITVETLEKRGQPSTKPEGGNYDDAVQYS